MTDIKTKLEQRCPPSPDGSSGKQGSDAHPVAVWAPIETAPKDGRQILTVVDGFLPGNYQWVEVDGVGRWSEDPETFMEEEHFRAYFFGSNYEPTHWMPLPAPPSGYRPGLLIFSDEGLGTKEDTSKIDQPEQQAAMGWPQYSSIIDKAEIITWQDGQQGVLLTYANGWKRRVALTPPSGLPEGGSRFPESPQGSEGTKETGGEYVRVPREPTEAMIMAGHSETPFCHADPEACQDIIGDRTCNQAIRDVWLAMIEAALLSPSHNREKAGIRLARRCDDCPTDGQPCPRCLQAALASPSSKTGD